MVGNGMLMLAAGYGLRIFHVWLREQDWFDRATTAMAQAIDRALGAR